MQKWEYCLVLYDGPRGESSGFYLNSYKGQRIATEELEMLNLMGSQGWELMERAPYYFKRTKP
jgi:hypothetical protein